MYLLSLFTYVGELFLLVDNTYHVGHLTLLIFSIGFAPLVLKEFQLLYYQMFNKIFFVHFSLIKHQLSKKEIHFLNEKVRFFRKLSFVEKKQFNHRVSFYLKNIRFINRDIHITQEMKLFVSATLAMLTFGYRNYKLAILENIVIYPKQYVSSVSGKMYKGEFNPKLKTVVFSWEDFLLGYETFNDNVNLGIHEFSHVLHANSIWKKDLNSIIFKREFRALLHLIKTDKVLNSRLVKSGYLRAYAFKNKFELLAVLLENFIETQEDFENNSPEF
jgi:Mlc titration factor MtfA (ptsG expression regulator)